MQFVSHAYQDVQNYYSGIPNNTGMQMLYSFGSACIIRSVFSNDPRAGLIAGAFAATATAIHALATPLFARIISPRFHLTWGEEMCRTCVALIGTGYVAAAFGDLSILNDLFTLSVIYGLLTYLKDERCDIDKAAWFGILVDYHPTR